MTDNSGNTIISQTGFTPYAVPQRVQRSKVKGKVQCNGIHPLLQACFYGLVFAIPFDTAQFPVENFAVTKLIGLIFFFAAFFQPRLCFRRPGSGFWYFAFYGCVYALLGAFVDPAYFEIVLTRIITLMQLLGLLWVASNLLQEKTIVRNVWLSFLMGCSLLAVMQLSGFGQEPQKITSAVQSERLTTMGANPNELCGLLGMALLVLISFVSDAERTPRSLRLFALPGTALLMSGMLLSESRGGLLAFGSGMLALLCTYGNALMKIRRGALMLTLLALLIGIGYSQEALRLRIEESVEQGKLAQREMLYPAAGQMIQEKPWTGWGPVEHRYELGQRTYWSYKHNDPDTHNLFLWLLTEGGLLGTIPYVLGIAFCTRAAWRSREGSQSVLPLALLLVALTVNLSGTWIYQKIIYLIFAYTLASEAALDREKSVLRSHSSSSALSSWRRSVSRRRNCEALR